MKENNLRPALEDVLLPAMRDAFLNAAELSKQTNTPFITGENGKILEIPPHKIDDYVNHVKTNVWKN